MLSHPEYCYSALALYYLLYYGGCVRSSIPWLGSLGQGLHVLVHLTSQLQVKFEYRSQQIDILSSQGLVELLLAVLIKGREQMWFNTVCYTAHLFVYYFGM